MLHFEAKTELTELMPPGIHVWGLCPCPRVLHGSPYSTLWYGLCGYFGLTAWSWLGLGLVVPPESMHLLK